jgi:hypothetical protein
MKLIAQIASILVAIYFIYDGATKLNHYFEHQKVRDLPGRIVEAFHPKVPLVIVSSEDNFAYFKAVRDSAEIRHPLEVQAVIYQPGLIDTLDSQNIVLILDSDLLKNRQAEKKLDRFDYFYVEPNYPIDDLMRFLKYYSFKTSKQVHFEFKRQSP